MATNTTAHTEVPGGHAKGPFPPFDPNVFAPQLIWLALVFGTLANLVSPRRIPWVGDWENYIETKALKEKITLITAAQARTWAL